MSNIGWDRRKRNPVVTEDQIISKPEPLEHYEALKVEKDATEGQKEFARRYNNMRKKLLEVGLMQDK